MSIVHSLSKIGVFEQCGAKYKFQYIDKFPREQSPTAARGVDLHDTIDRLLKGQEITLAPPLDFYYGFFAGLKKQPELFSEYKVAVDREWNLWKGDWGDSAVYTRAVLDLLVPPRDGTIYIYDWKSGKVYDNHKDQRELYSLFGFALYPDAFEVRFESVYLDLGKSNGETYHRDNRSSVQARWNERFSKLEGASEFLPNPQYACRWCPFSKAKGGPCLF